MLHVIFIYPFDHNYSLLFCQDQPTYKSVKYSTVRWEGRGRRTVVKSVSDPHPFHNKSLKITYYYKNKLCLRPAACILEVTLCLAKPHIIQSHINFIHKA